MVRMRKLFCVHAHTKAFISLLQGGVAHFFGQSEGSVHGRPDLPSDQLPFECSRITIPRKVNFAV